MKHFQGVLELVGKQQIIVTIFLDTFEVELCSILRTNRVRLDFYLEK